jgi:hypothetical protein
MFCSMLDERGRGGVEELIPIVPDVVASELHCTLNDAGRQHCRLFECKEAKEGPAKFEMAIILASRSLAQYVVV